MISWTSWRVRASSMYSRVISWRNSFHCLTMVGRWNKDNNNNNNNCDISNCWLNVYPAIGWKEGKSPKLYGPDGQACLIGGFRGSSTALDHGNNCRMEYCSTSISIRSGQSSVQDKEKRRRRSRRVEVWDLGKAIVTARGILRALYVYANPE